MSDRPLHACGNGITVHGGRGALPINGQSRRRDVPVRRNGPHSLGTEKRKPVVASNGGKTGNDADLAIAGNVRSANGKF